jgi:hypothetical protein
VTGVAKLPNETVIDGEVVAFDEEGKPSFSALQNYGSAPGQVVFYVFDVMILAGRDLREESLDSRRELLELALPPRLGFSSTHGLEPQRARRGRRGTPRDPGPGCPWDYDPGDRRPPVPGRPSAPPKPSSKRPPPGPRLAL